MTGTTAEQQGYLEDFEKLAARASRNGGAWVGDLRRGAMERFRSLGFPTTRDEEWKYTSLEALRRARLRTVDAPASIPAGGFDPFDAGGWERYELAFPWTGKEATRPEASDGQDEDLFVGRLAEAVEQRLPWVEAHLGRHADYDGHALRALNTAFVEDGGAVRVGRGRTLDRPVHLAFRADPAQAPDRIVHPRTLVVVGAGSRLTLVETYAGSGDAVYCTNAVTEIVLEDDAELDHYRLVREGGGTFHIGTVQVHQARNSRYRSHSVTTGGAITRVELNALLDGEGADCMLHGLYVAAGAQHVDSRTAIEHARPHGTSRELYKGVLNDRARAVFNGKIVVRQEAQKTDARQSNRNLMLSRDAEIDSKPQLEILADDVRCAHGTTIGQLEEDEMFYLRSRGLNAAVARKLLVHGFASEILDGVAIEPLRDGLTSRVLAELGA
ncbi:MAG: Fe-S cluster assembly protein SufD [Deltaproteobacteria bacterium]|nr:Fe-S cluster assembly protein SufD [Deltaproteobacteria bacterium]